jgi:hypothetical protein
MGGVRWGFMVTHGQVNMCSYLAMSNPAATVAGRNEQAVAQLKVAALHARVAAGHLAA